MASAENIENNLDTPIIIEYEKNRIRRAALEEKIFDNQWAIDSIYGPDTWDIKRRTRKYWPPKAYYEEKNEKKQDKNDEKSREKARKKEKYKNLAKDIGNEDKDLDEDRTWQIVSLVAKKMGRGEMMDQKKDTKNKQNANEVKAQDLFNEVNDKLNFSSSSMEAGEEQARKEASSLSSSFALIKQEKRKSGDIGSNKDKQIRRSRKMFSVIKSKVRSKESFRDINSASIIDIGGERVGEKDYNLNIQSILDEKWCFADLLYVLDQKAGLEFSSKRRAAKVQDLDEDLEAISNMSKKELEDMDIEHESEAEEDKVAQLEPAKPSVLEVAKSQVVPDSEEEKKLKEEKDKQEEERKKKEKSKTYLEGLSKVFSREEKSKRRDVSDSIKDLITKFEPQETDKGQAEETRDTAIEKLNEFYKKRSNYILTYLYIA